MCPYKNAAIYKYRSTNKYGSVLWMGTKGFLFRLMLRIISAKCSTSTSVRTTCSVILYYKVSVYCYHWVEEQQVLWSGLLQYVPLFLNGKYSCRAHRADFIAQTHVTKWPYFIFMCCMKVMWENKLLSLCLSPCVFHFPPFFLSWIKVGIYIFCLQWHNEDRDDDKQRVFTIRRGIQMTAGALYSSHSWSSNSTRSKKVKARQKSTQSQANVKSDALRMYVYPVPSLYNISHCSFTFC